MNHDAQEDLMRRYLLGDTTPEELTAVEDEIATSADFAENLAAIEEELVVQYLQSRLPRDRQARFDEVYLNSDAGRRRIAEIEAFRGLVARDAPASAAAPVPAPAPAPANSESRRAVIPVWVWAVAAVIVLALGGSLLVNRQRAVDSADDPVPPSPIVVTLQLAPGLTRSVGGNTNVFRIAEDAEFVDLELNVETQQGNIRASLRRVGETARPITSSPRVAGRTMAWRVPAATLSPGDYVLSLFSGSPDDTIATRAFTIRR